MTPRLDDNAAAWPLPHGGIETFLSTLSLPTSTAIERLMTDGGASIVEDQTGSHLRLDAQAIASLTESVARNLGLPPKSPYGFDLRLQGAMGKPGASLLTRWLQPGRTLPARDIEVMGVWIAGAGDRRYRIPSPIFEVLSLARSFNNQEDATIDDQFRIWARIREQLGDQQASTVTDGFLRGLRVVTASALTFGITTDDRGDVQIQPVLLNAASTGDGEETHHVRALTEEDEPFLTKRLDELREGASAFPINQGTYVVVDEALQDALRAVRKLRQSPADQRKRAAMYPEAVIREVLGQDETTASVFVETERFSERVRDVGDWVTPAIPWVKIPSQDWDAPAIRCGIRINGVEIPIEPNDLGQIEKDLTQALATDQPTVAVSGSQIPATKANLAAIQQLRHAADAARPDNKLSAKEREEAIRATKVLIVETNLDAVDYGNETTGKRRPGLPSLPQALKTTPKPHQEIGIEWLQRHWIAGSRGALLCDDMGLGKTYQALAFCAWLRELMADGVIPRQPILIVAPVGLLRNWELEINDHLFAPGLGDIVRAYGIHLASLKRGRHIEGTAALDTAALARGDLVLANYEAVSDYQLSFGAVPFCATVFDEAQKIKSPKARMTAAAKGLNSLFQVAMTGTPIENRLADLWCIADTVQPGALADLKDFSARYESPDADTRALRDLVWQDEDDAADPPRLLLRRLKGEKLKGLPPKYEHVAKRVMPARQFEAYARAIEMKEMIGPQGMLGMIHALRRISLHPILVEGGAASGEELKPEDSARMAETMEILARISASGEKALIFLESLDLQEANQLPMLIKRQFGLERSPMVINGEVSTEARQARVALFQKQKGFDVMLLSPKAGGVGLTLTAANHVIHLSRWWNPAVEDQCSDRVYRIGQEKPVHIYYPLAVLPEVENASFDEQLQILMDRKRARARDLLEAPAFTPEDYGDLLRGTGIAG